jgi:hypothetical protein
VVVKFSRFAQEVPLYIAEQEAVEAPAQALAGAHFHTPFEEFGLLKEFRDNPFGPACLRVRTHRPLAIYSPPTEYPVWQLGRARWLFDNHQRALNQLEQAAGHRSEHIELSFKREYITLFGWVKGDDAQTMFEHDLLDRAEMQQLTHRVMREMRARGFRVLDHKPRHFILRQRHTGKLMRRNGELVYALIDFELLQRTEEYEEFLAAQPPETDAP